MTPLSWTNFPNGNQAGIFRSNINNAMTALKAFTEEAKAEFDTLALTHHVALSAVCTAASQEPTGLDAPMQITFGAAQGTVSDEVMIDANGTVTFNKTGKYIAIMTAQYGRTGAIGTSLMLFRMLYNGTQYGPTLAAKIENANVLLPWMTSVYFDVTAGDTLQCYIARDSSGDNSGGVFSITPATLAWGAAPCASLTIINA